MSLPVSKESRRSLFVLIGLLLEGNPKLFGCGCIDKFPNSDKSPNRSQLLLDAIDCVAAATATGGVLSNEFALTEDRLPLSEIPPNKLGTVDDIFGGGMTFGKTVGKPLINWELLVVSENAAVKSANPSFNLDCGWLLKAVSKSPNSLTFFVSLVSPALGSKSSFNKLVAVRNQ